MEKKVGVKSQNKFEYTLRESGGSDKIIKSSDSRLVEQEELRDKSNKIYSAIDDADVPKKFHSARYKNIIYFPNH